MDRELLKEISAVSGFYEDIDIGNYSVPLLATGMNGIYVCFDDVSSCDFCKEAYDAIKKRFGLRDGQLFLFRIAEDDSGDFYDYINDFVQQENIYEAYENCYANHLIPQADLFHIQFESLSDYCNAVDYEPCDDYEEDAKSYVMPVISEKQLAAVEKRLVDILEQPETDGQYRIYPDGHMEIKRTITKSVVGISTFIEEGTVYYPCMDADGDKFFLLAFLGGWFGAHKFKTGNYLKGLFYLLTCGCCGVFYVLDLLSILLGGYNYSMIKCDKSKGTVEFQKKKYFSRPVKKKARAALLLIAAVAIAFVLVKFIYIPVLENVNVLIASILSETKLADDIANIMQLN